MGEIVCELCTKIKKLEYPFGECKECTFAMTPYERQYKETMENIQKGEMPIYIYNK